MTDIRLYHAHVYFDPDSRDRARALCERAGTLFGIDMGRMHDGPVGPHPMGSCQLAFGPEKFAEVVPWLALNRDGLIVFVHPDTGDDLADHRDHALWMGGMPALDLSLFSGG